MGIEDFNELELLQGSTTVIFVALSVILGLKILSRYFSRKQVEYITIGLTWILMSSGWWRGVVNFVSILFIGEKSPIGVLIDILFIPIALICWIFSFSHLLYPNSEKKIVIPFSIVMIIYEILIIALYSINPEYIGSAVLPFHNTYGILHRSFLFGVIVIVIITGILFAKRSMKSSDPRIQWRGKFLLLAFSSFAVSGILDAVFDLTALLVVIVRLLLILSAIEYYLGFLLPKRLEKWLIKEPPSQ